MGTGFAERQSCTDVCILAQHAPIQPEESHSQAPHNNVYIPIHIPALNVSTMPLLQHTQLSPFLVHPDDYSLPVLIPFELLSLAHVPWNDRSFQVACSFRVIQAQAVITNHCNNNHYDDHHRHHLNDNHGGYQRGPE